MGIHCGYVYGDLAFKGDPGAGSYTVGATMLDVDGKPVGDPWKGKESGARPATSSST